MSKNLLVFDLDGTLINSKKDIIKSFNYAFNKNNCKKIDTKFFIQNANKGSIYFIRNNLKKNETFKLKKINYDFTKHYKNNCINTTKPRKGVKYFLNWSSKRYINVISTNKPKSLSKKILKKLDLLKYVDEIFGVDSLKYKKPNPKHLKKILNIYKINCQNCIFFGDSDVDWEMAKKLSVKFNFQLKSHILKSF